MMDHWASERVEDCVGGRMLDHWASERMEDCAGG